MFIEKDGETLIRVDRCGIDSMTALCDGLVFIKEGDHLYVSFEGVLKWHRTEGNTGLIQTLQRALERFKKGGVEWTKASGRNRTTRSQG